MRNLTQSELLAKPEVKRAIEKATRLLRGALPEGTFAERESALLTITNEACRGVLVAELVAIAESFPDEIVVNGTAYRRHERGAGSYHSLCGALAVPRDTFREMGVRNGPTVVPLELVAGLVELATPGLAYNVAHGYAEHDMRAHEAELLTAHRVPPSRSTLERMAGAIATSAVDHVPRIEPLLRRSEKVPEGAVSVVMGLDRTAVAMLEERPEDASPKPEPKRTKPRLRRPPPPCDIKWRMAYVGTISFCDANGEALEIRRYAAPACDDPVEIVEQMTADLRVALKKRPELKAGIMQDGAHEMWDRTREGMRVLRAEGLLKRWYEGIDRYHLVERLAGALQILEPNAEKRKSLLDTWTVAFDERNATIDVVEDFLGRHFQAKHAKLTRQQRDEIADHLIYIGNNKDRMRYVTLRNAGLPVGSGVTESAAKTTVGKRAKGSSRRWREEKLRGVLTLRAVRQSDRLSRFWTHFSRRYVANVEALGEAA
jgi:hypothetical protein